MDEKLLWKLDIRNSRQHNTKQNKKKYKLSDSNSLMLKTSFIYFLKKILHRQFLKVN